jgi:hypothetical protein
MLKNKEIKKILILKNNVNKQEKMEALRIKINYQTR